MITNPLLYPGVKFAIIGLGVSGKAALRYALACGAEVSVSDNRSQEQLVAELTVFAADIDYEIGHSLEFLAKADVIFVSPGVACDDLLEELQKQGKVIVGELSLAAPVINYPVIAVTGTNGKTTVTSLIGQLLKDAGKNVFVGGNIGTPLLDWLCENETVDYIVLELSSFQLEYMGDFRVDIALLLNITPDHLDRHGDMASYLEAKMNIFTNQNEYHLALLPINDFDETPVNSQLCRFGVSEKADIVISCDEINFSMDNASHTFDLSKSLFANEIGRLNTAPSIYVAMKCGCSKESINNTINNFDLGEHRLEFVAEIGDVKYYNDSKATNTGAVNAALSQLDKVILIVGGQDKGDDYKLLRDMVQKKVTDVICIGQATELIENALVGYVKISRAKTMKDAVDLATELAHVGQNILLSPACSSFDMFKNYQDRGEQFKAAVLDKQLTSQIEYEKY